MMILTKTGQGRLFMSSQVVTKKGVPLGEITSYSGVHHCNGGSGVRRA